MTGLGLATQASGLVTGIAALALLLIAAAILLGRWPVWLLGLLVAGLAVAAAFLVRDPPRVQPEGRGLILAPADGRVLAVDSVDHHSYLGARARRVTVRSGLLDVHVLRSPADGVVDYIEETGAEHRVGINTGRLRLLLSHHLHRTRLRVVEGQLVDPGQRTGLAPMGSRIEILLPLETDVRVRPGDRVQAGRTVLATPDRGAS